VLSSLQAFQNVNRLSSCVLQEKENGDKIARIGEWAKKPLFRGGVRALGGDGAFHQQDEKSERAPERGKDDVRVEIGKRRGLLLAQLFEGLRTDR